ncbi:hypothetical protein IRZ71_18275 [Flavobacterium sp. ANB]|uniref:hypothetical protein n=1 Tax=unclassified Flavobacterium TaxID=196869 RepID=UPI0012B6CD2C|nr:MULTISPECIES: hypothetical protein [unclassified Flavobacterium]MBF4518309.1 hypothetical protein [Flavobacterium sp. ANB]MTD70994.1 hypothetical protein [Flavobacterium sp. LC2016-13]
MKHIKKKYFLEEKLKTINKETLGLKKNFDSKDLKNLSKTHDIVIETSDNELIFAFIYNDNGNHVTIPLPDFTLVYYDFSYKLNIDRKESKKIMLKNLKNVNHFTELNGEVLYRFYGYSSSCIINLFTSIECFINHLLPENKNYIEVNNNRTEIYNKTQIQQYIQFWDKLKKVLPQFYNKNFFQKSTPTNEHIFKLKELRDNIIHTKSEDSGALQIELFKQILNFKYDETFIAVAKFMNFYQPKYIEDCPCEKEF